MPGRLVLCSTPIGNLGDVSERLRRALTDADDLYAEDTRRTATLLRHLGIERPARSYFAGNEHERADELERHLADGRTVALVTDAGTPSISDPGLTAVQAAGRAGAEVTVVPGPSAVTAALAVSGLPSERFVFEGFLPRKGGDRRRRIDELAAEQRTIVLFSAARRLGADLADLAATLGDDRQVTIAREMTKLHEEVWRGDLAAACDWAGGGVRGEVTIVVAGAVPAPPEIPDLVPDVVRAIDAGQAASAAVREAARRHGVSRRALYEAVNRERAP